MESLYRTGRAANGTVFDIFRAFSRLAAGLVMAAWLVSAPWLAAEPTTAMEQKADAVFQRLIKPDDAGLAVLVAQDGKILFEKGYGLADLEHRTAITSETKFRIGSITKQFTAAAILRLQEEGKLSAQDKLSKYIPDFPRGDEVTLHHLLTHTSGIHSYTSKPGFMEGVTNSTTAEAVIKSFKQDPYDFDPGAKWAYDNSGYMLLGYIVEKVSGQTYADFLREKFFQPLGMTNTGVYTGNPGLTHEALGYSYKEGKFERAVNWNMSWAGGAGALYSTVEDLYRWNEGLFSGKVLSEASLKAAFAPVKTKENQDDDAKAGYGYGWILGEVRGMREIWHNGGLNGFSSSLLRLPEEKFTIAILADSEPGAPEVVPGELARKLVEIYLADKLAPPPTANTNVSAKAFDAIAGRYDFGGPVLNVTREHEHLFAQLSGQRKLELFASSETDFFCKEVDAQITFVKGTDGKVVEAIHHQNGLVIHAPRLADLVEAKVDPTKYDSVVGKYDYGQGQMILTVTREGERLFAQMSGQPKFEIFPKSDTEFFWKVVDAQITFVKDDKGKVTKAIHHQGGHSLDAPRLE